MDKVRFGVIGLGNMGSGHVNNLFAGKIPGAVLTAVCDIKPERANEAAEAYAQSYGFSSADEAEDYGFETGKRP